MDPIDCELDGLTFSVSSTYTFLGNGIIQIERSITNMSDPDAQIEIEEYHRGCWGDTQYPADMHSIQLSISDTKGIVHEQLKYNYQCRKSVLEHASSVSATIPQVNSTVTLAPAPNEGIDTARFEEGYMSSPYYTLALKKKISNGGSLRSWLTIARR